MTFFCPPNLHPFAHGIFLPTKFTHLCTWRSAAHQVLKIKPAGYDLKAAKQCGVCVKHGDWQRKVCFENGHWQRVENCHWQRVKRSQRKEIRTSSRGATL
jgi:hypothetical protein